MPNPPKHERYFYGPPVPWDSFVCPWCGYREPDGDCDTFDWCGAEEGCVFCPVCNCEFDPVSRRVVVPDGGLF